MKSTLLADVHVCLAFEWPREARQQEIVTLGSADVLFAAVRVSKQEVFRDGKSSLKTVAGQSVALPLSGSCCESLCTIVPVRAQEKSDDADALLVPIRSFAHFRFIPIRRFALAAAERLALRPESAAAPQTVEFTHFNSSLEFHRSIMHQR